MDLSSLTAVKTNLEALINDAANWNDITAIAHSLLTIDDMKPILLNKARAVRNKDHLRSAVLRSVPIHSIIISDLMRTIFSYLTITDPANLEKNDCQPSYNRRPDDNREIEWYESLPIVCKEWKQLLQHPIFYKNYMAEIHCNAEDDCDKIFVRKDHSNLRIKIGAVSFGKDNSIGGRVVSSPSDVEDLCLDTISSWIFREGYFHQGLAVILDIAGKSARFVNLSSSFPPGFIFHSAIGLTLDTFAFGDTEEGNQHWITTESYPKLQYLTIVDPIWNIDSRLFIDSGFLGIYIDCVNEMLARFPKIEAFAMTLSHAIGRYIDASIDVQERVLKMPPNIRFINLYDIPPIIDLSDCTHIHRLELTRTYAKQIRWPKNGMIDCLLSFRGKGNLKFKGNEPVRYAYWPDDVEESGYYNESNEMEYESMEIGNNFGMRKLFKSRPIYGRFDDVMKLTALTDSKMANAAYSKYPVWWKKYGEAKWVADSNHVIQSVCY